MGKINEATLDEDGVVICFKCEENEGAIFMCGEGMMCTSCYADEAGIEEAAAFLGAEDDPEIRQRVHESLSGRDEDVSGTEPSGVQ